MSDGTLGCGGLLLVACVIMVVCGVFSHNPFLHHDAVIFILACLGVIADFTVCYALIAITDPLPSPLNELCCTVIIMVGVSLWVFLFVVAAIHFAAAFAASDYCKEKIGWYNPRCR